MSQESPNNSGTQIIIRIFAVTIVAIIVAVSSLILWWWFTSPKVVVEADEGFKKAEATIDPEKLRAWALEEISKQSTNANVFMSNSEIPTNIANLYSDSPEDVSVKKYDDPNQSYVEICWGGGFFHWMIDIGSTNYTETTGAANDYTTVEWVPGIYYTREDTRHPFK
jgi:hypothetical protein